MRLRSLRRAIVLLTFTFAATFTPSLRAEPSSNEVAIPSALSLDDALSLFHAHGYDLLAADASVYAAEADVQVAGAIANPSITGIYGRIVDPKYSTGDCPSCSKNAWTFGLGDNGALFDTLSDKRGLRLSVARKALAVVKLGRADVQRQLDLQVKQAYVSFAAASFALDFAKEVQASAQKTLDINKARFPGKIDEGALARIETAKLEADRQLDLATSNVKIARVGLSYLLGVRGKIPTFVVAGKPLELAIPTALSSASEQALLEKAMAHRPDLAAGKVEKERAEDSLVLAKRLRFPDVALMVQYAQMGTGQNAIQPPTVSFGVTVTLPTFYQHQGEIKKAQSDIYLGTVTIQKLEAKVQTEVSAAFETWVTQKKVVERMEGELLGRAKKARDITEAQFNEGKALLTDMLDAQRTYIATNLEYVDDLAGYWNAIFALEQAVGMDLRK
jgi:cobalt-zinc-cadmium efflux system outer membrane protein